MDGNKIDVMGELIKFGLEFLRKSAGIVVVLAFLCGGLIWIALEQKREMMLEINTNRAEYRQKLQTVSARLDACEEARGRLVTEVEVLKVKVEVLGKGKR